MRIQVDNLLAKLSNVGGLVLYFLGACEQTEEFLIYAFAQYYN